jgi:AraC-like DNA-binding protein
MSRSKFALRFRELVGTTPASYVADWRLALAERLLMQNQPVKVVADAVGYGSQGSFTRAFTVRNGMPPKERLRQRSGEE